MPAEVKVRPSSLVKALFKVVPTVPALIVTASWKVIVPAASSEVIPVAVTNVLAKVVAPVLLIVIAGPVPVPIGVFEPTTPSKRVWPATANVKSRAPSTFESKVRSDPAPVRVMATEPPVRLT